MAYVNTGPFNNGTSPGINAAFLNNVEGFLDTVNTAATDSNLSSSSGILTMLGLVNNDAGTTISGTTNGSATLYQFLRGNVKAFFIYFSAYRNSTTTEQKITLPQPFNHYAHFYAAGGVPPCHFYLSGSQVNGKISVVTAFASPPGSGVSTASQNAINGLEYGDISNAFDTVGLGVSLGANFTTGLFVIGV